MLILVENMKPHIERSIGAAATHTFPVAVLNEQGKIESANSKFIEITGFTEQELSFGKTIQINDTKSQSEPFSLTKIGGDACWEGDLELDLGKGMYEIFFTLGSRIHHLITHPKTKFAFVFLHPEVKRNAELSLETYFDLEGPLLCVANLDGYFVKVSLSFIQLLGYDETEFT